MHTTAYKFFERVALHCLPSWNVLDVGSLDVNGSLQPVFDVRSAGDRPDDGASPPEPGRYLGVDMRPGPNVAVVANAHSLPFRDETFDVVVSTSMLEHDDRPWLSAKELARVLRRDGLIAIAVPGFGFPRHEHPDDYWRFSSSALEVLFPRDVFSVMVSMDSEEVPGVPDAFFMGKKR